MRQPPKLQEFWRYPAVSAVALAAIAATALWWAGRDISWMVENPYVRRGQLWRLLTSALLHVNLLHLAFNLYWFWVFGTLIEKSFGHLRAIGLFVVLAAGSSAAEYALMDGGVGLSGIGYGFFTMLWVLKKRDERFADAIDAQTIGLFVAWFVLCIVATVTGAMPVANIAHGAGAALGTMVGGAMVRQPWRAALAGMACLFVVAGVVGATVARPLVNCSRNAGDDDARLGYEAFSAGRHQDAARWYSAAAALSPSNADAWYGLGVSFHKLGKCTMALAAYRRAHELRPDDQQYSWVFSHGRDAALLGYEALMENRNTDAVRFYSKAIEGDPANADHWSNLGIAHDRLGNAAEAVAAYRKAAELAPQDQRPKSAEPVQTR